MTGDRALGDQDDSVGKVPHSAGWRDEAAAEQTTRGEGRVTEEGGEVRMDLFRAGRVSWTREEGDIPKGRPCSELDMEHSGGGVQQAELDSSL